MTTYNNKPVIQEGEFDTSTAKIGDYVSQAVVDDFMDCMPPACMSSRCSQLGEPYSMRKDPDTGNYRNTYLTFTRIAPGVWMYCGNCFRGEITERGEDPVWA